MSCLLFLCFEVFPRHIGEIENVNFYTIVLISVADPEPGIQEGFPDSMIRTQF